MYMMHLVCENELISCTFSYKSFEGKDILLNFAMCFS